MRIAIYARVSTDDKGQDPENQLRQLRQWCADAGHTIAHEYIDHNSGRKGTKGRKQFPQLFEDAHKRKFDCVLFWALDRFTREGMTPTIAYLQRLASYGVSFPQKIGERTRAGMARARAQGKRIGRPALDPALQRKIAKQLGAGLSAYAVAKQLGIDAHTVAKYSTFDASTAIA